MASDSTQVCKTGCREVPAHEETCCGRVRQERCEIACVPCTPSSAMPASKWSIRSSNPVAISLPIPSLCVDTEVKEVEGRRFSWRKGYLWREGGSNVRTGDSPGAVWESLDPPSFSSSAYEPACDFATNCPASDIGYSASRADGHLHKLLLLIELRADVNASASTMLLHWPQRRSP